MESWTEEDIKIKCLVPYLQAKGFNLLDMNFERPFQVTVGTKKIVVRSDILVKIKGQPAIVIEVKRPSHKISKSDIDQAISYARLCERIPPFVMITNSEETKLYDTITGLEVEDLESYDEKLNISSRMHITDELKRDALGKLFRLNYDFLLDFCQSQRETQMVHLLGGERRIGRFDPELFSSRRNVEREFRNFLNSQDPCFALIGDQGTGKTFCMIELAEKYGKKFPVLFYDASYIPKTLEEAIEEDFGWRQRRRQWVGEIFADIERILKEHKSKMIVFIDAINEPIPNNSRKVALVNLIRRLHNMPVKICVACRSEDWKFFFTDKGELGAISWWIYIPSVKSIDSINLRNYIESGSCSVQNFSDSELDIVFPIYKRIFKIRGGLSKQARKLCKHPETLRFVSEVFHHRKIPYSLRRLKLLEEFWLRKVEAIGAHEVVENLFFTIGNLILDRRNPEIDEISLSKSINWNEAYQIVYDRALSENILVRRKDDTGNMRIKISVDLIMEYIVARILLQRHPYRKTSISHIIELVNNLMEDFRGFTNLNGILLLYCSLLDNPPDLVSCLLQKLDIEEVIDHVLDESPAVIDVILADGLFRSNLMHSLIKENKFHKFLRIIIWLLQDRERVPFIVEIVLSEGLQRHRIRLAKLMDYVCTRAKSEQVFSYLLNSLLSELERRGQRRYMDFIYCINSVNTKLARKMLAKFDIGKLKRLVTSTIDPVERGRSLYLLSKISAKTASRVDPTGRILHQFTKALEDGRVEYPNPLKGSMRLISKTYLHEKVLHLLQENFHELTWKQIHHRLQRPIGDRYKTLGAIEALLSRGYIGRERKENRFIYKISKIWTFQKAPLKSGLSLIVASRKRNIPRIRELTRKIVASDFGLTPSEFDNHVEELMLGWYISKRILRFTLEVFSCSIDIATDQETYTLEIPGKTLRFLIAWLEKLTNGDYAAEKLKDNISKTAPAMFKNMIYGTRASTRRRALDYRKPLEIRSAEQLEQRLSEFVIFFGNIGVYTPTKDSIFHECIRNRRKAIRFLDRLTDIFKEKSAELASLDKTVGSRIDRPLYIPRDHLAHDEKDYVLMVVAKNVINSISPENVRSVYFGSHSVTINRNDGAGAFIFCWPKGYLLERNVLLWLRCYSENRKVADDLASKILETVRKSFN